MGLPNGFTRIGYGEQPMLPALLCLMALVDQPPTPITPSQLHDALQVPPRGEAAEALAARIRAAFPEGTDLKAGGKPAGRREHGGLRRRGRRLADAAAAGRRAWSTTAGGSTSSRSARPGSGPASS